MEDKRVQLAATEKTVVVKEGFDIKINVISIDVIPEFSIARCDYGKNINSLYWLIPNNNYEDSIDKIKMQIINDYKNLFEGI